MLSNDFTKTAFLTRFSLRKNWLKLTVWTIAMAGMFTAIAAKFTSIYGTQAAIDSVMETLRSPAMTALFGKMPSGVSSSADIFAAEMTVFMAIMAVVMNYSIVIKNLRGEEEIGITEIIRAHAVGKLSLLGATLIEAVILNLGIGLLYALGLTFADLSGTDLNGNFLLGLGLGFAGLMFASIAALISQIVDNSRNSTILSYVVFGIMYVARMSTDISDPKLTWWIPFGWVEKFSTYKDNNWTPVLSMIIFTIIAFALAFFINSKRDVNAGLIATKPGRKHASVFLNGTFSLFLKLHKTSIIVWTIGLLILGFTYGSIFSDIGDIIKTNPTLEQMLGKSAIHAANVAIIKQFISMLMIIFAVLSLIPGMQIIHYLKTGENKGYLEMIHAKPVGRTKLYLNSIIIATVTTLLVLAATLYGLYLGGVYSMKDPIALKTFIKAYVAYISPVLIMLGITAAIIGTVPKLSSINYLYLTAALIIQYFGKLLKFPDWPEKLTPFGYIAQVPVKNADTATIVWQLAIAAVLFGIGYIGYIRRDLK
ncbi:ABC transporter permease [Companilactobacillus furfuricola]|uniref:ABC transporter permease n=1 Tax=Companilactobacillus furfuricola TaxID=1462575 RepID=UPI000F7769AE|nr:ABC transporter permease [Companilactobacillus furfuricola]